MMYIRSVTIPRDSGVDVRWLWLIAVISLTQSCNRRYIRKASACAFDIKRVFSVHVSAGSCTRLGNVLIQHKKCLMMPFNVHLYNGHTGYAFKQYIRPWTSVLGGRYIFHASSWDSQFLIFSSIFLLEKVNKIGGEFCNNVRNAVTSTMENRDPKTIVRLIIISEEKSEYLGLVMRIRLSDQEKCIHETL